MIYTVKRKKKKEAKNQVSEKANIPMALKYTSTGVE